MVFNFIVHPFLLTFEPSNPFLTTAFCQSMTNTIGIYSARNPIVLAQTLPRKTVHTGKSTHFNMGSKKKLLVYHSH